MYSKDNYNLTEEKNLLDLKKMGLIPVVNNYITNNNFNHDVVISGGTSSFGSGNNLNNYALNLNDLTNNLLDEIRNNNEVINKEQLEEIIKNITKEIEKENPDNHKTKEFLGNLKTTMETLTMAPKIISMGTEFVNYVTRLIGLN